MNNKEQEIKKIIDNPITQSMKPWQKALESTFSKPGTEKISPNQITVSMDKWENKLANQRKPEN